jgi:hypothetical protein
MGERTRDRGLESTGSMTLNCSSATNFTRDYVGPNGIRPWV